MRDLSLTLIQAETVWHDPAANRQAYDERLARLQAPGDVVVLCEMFSTGFTMASTEQAETMEGPTVAWMLLQAARLDAVVCGSVVIADQDACYNRLVWARPDGRVEHYDKRHLFRMANEQSHYAPGRERRVFTWRDWRICPQVCYDLRFPVFSRNRSDYDLLLYVANWPAPRTSQWLALLKARAIENQCYVAGVNRIGLDGNDVPYAGGSGCWDPLGRSLVEAGEVHQVLQVELDGEALRAYRSNFPAWMDADHFHIEGEGRS
ncbi:MAG: amidohydrolase [Gammaproteobacteria bacterium]|nr:amidohydrolase [Gammaproteobacteria bacterium]